MMGTTKRIIITIVFLCFSSSVFSATVWVDDNGAATYANCQGATPLSGASACSLSTANSNAVAGDTINMRTGTYGTGIAPSNSGTNNTTRITYQNYNDEVVTISNVDTGILLTNRDYVTITGSSNQRLLITNIDKGLTMDDGDYNIFDYLTIGPERNTDRWRFIWIGPDSDYNWFKNSTFYEGGYITAGDDYGNMFAIGGNPPGTTSYNLVENCVIYYGGHTAGEDSGSYNIWRNNYFHNEVWDNGYGNRPFHTKDHDTNGQDTGWNLYEGNRFAYSGIPSDNSYAAGIQHSTPYCIYRKNFFYANDGPGLKVETYSSAPYGDETYIYHNVFFYNGADVTTDYALWLRNGACGSCTLDDTVVKNNIFYESQGANIQESGSVTGTVTANNWTTGNPNFVDAVPASTTDPSNQNYPNFNLQSNSGAIDNGGWLTTITQTTGSGTSFTVADAKYFFDISNFPSYMGLVGDAIKTEGGQTAIIASINRGTNTITVESSISWTQNEGLALDYNGVAPDQGAIEYTEGVVGDISSGGNGTVGSGGTGTIGSQ